MSAAVFSGTTFVGGEALSEIISSDLELSFWGGVDPATSEVIDRHHPLSRQVLTDKVLVIPGGRGSCSGTGVILELLLTDKSPAAIVTEREDDILTLGVVIAEEVFGRSIPVIMLDPRDFRQVAAARFARIAGNRVACGNDAAALRELRLHQDQTEHSAPRIELSDADQAFLDGVHGKASQVAMRVIVRMARLQGADRLIDVTQAHIDGCVYTGHGGLRFAQQLRDWGGRVVVPTTLNSISVDYRRWRVQGIDPAFGEPASQLGDTYVDMGARPTFTCAPYLLDSAPAQGEQIVWAESNAVVYANSVLGARTMKYPDFLDICIALTGRAPRAGCHIESNRRAALQINLPKLKNLDDAFYPLLGYHIGLLAANRIPVVVGLEQATPSQDDLKAFGAAFATTSSAPMFHILGVTPEAAALGDATDGQTRPAFDIHFEDLIRSWRELDSATDRSVDLVSLGNPHFSFSECERLATLCRGRTKHKDVAVVVTCARATHDRAREAGLVSELERFGVEFVTDTCWCMIIEPVIPSKTTVIMTNSGKYAHYGPGLTGRRFHFGSLTACVEAACTGITSAELPPWLRSYY
ncbi:cis-3-hydroxy-L-proline dehydratase [Microvirga yunnanensis]|uniref:cis-3-hydroxy-L-proline dehydratase n=1 Tax=Microvirga yunnanensis TaxID=2953740 RepID=UPI0021CA5A1F|nr:aconitase family protein [Microvirga sp. HBU65207]